MTLNLPQFWRYLSPGLAKRRAVFSMPHLGNAPYWRDNSPFHGYLFHIRYVRHFQAIFTFVVSVRNCLASTLDYTWIQMLKQGKVYCRSTCSCSHKFHHWIIRLQRSSSGFAEICQNISNSLPSPRPPPSPPPLPLPIPSVPPPLPPSAFPAGARAVKVTNAFQRYSKPKRKWIVNSPYSLCSSLVSSSNNQRISFEKS